MGVIYSATQDFDYFLGPLPSRFVDDYIIRGYNDRRLHRRLFVPIALHEFIHGLGFNSNIEHSKFQIPYHPTLFDRHFRHVGANPDRPEDMTPRQRDIMLNARGGVLRWVGTATSEAAGRIVPSGQVRGQVYLAGGYSVGHLSGAASQDFQLMDATGDTSRATTLRLGIAAYMLSDMGWGPVIDSRVTASQSGQNKMQVEVSTDAEAEQLLVNLQLPEGISIEDTTASPATCETTGQTTACRYTRLSGSAVIQYTLTGEPGIHEVKADVDHQALHVDENPVNNFATARVQVGKNTIRGVTLQGVTLRPRGGEVAGTLPAGTSVGRLQVTGPAGIDHSFALARGGEHNACFRIEGDQVLTSTELDYEALSELDIRVETTADNGFRREDDLEVRATDVASSPPDFTCPPVELTVFDEGVVGPTWDSGFSGRYFNETGTATCENDGGAGCQGINWLIVDDDSRGDVLQITSVNFGYSLGSRFYIKADSPVDVSRFEGGTIEFDVRVMSGDSGGVPEFLISMECVPKCLGYGEWSGRGDAFVGSEWVTLSVNVDKLIGPDAFHAVKTGIVIYVENDVNTTYRLDRVRWVADPDYDRIIQSVTLDPGEVAEAQPAGTSVGHLRVTGGPEGRHSFALARGGEHNACFRIEYGSQVLTRTELDYEALSELDIRVETTADNGFRREDDLKIRVTDVASSQPQPDFTCPPVELTVFDDGVAGPNTWWPFHLSADYVNEGQRASCFHANDGVECPISWSMVNDDSRGDVLEITDTVGDDPDLLNGRFYISRRFPSLDVSRFEGGTIEFDVRVMSGDPEFLFEIDCVYNCLGFRNQKLDAIVGSDWVTLRVNVDDLIGPDASYKASDASYASYIVETGFGLYVTNGVSTTYQLDRVRWVADPDYDRIGGSDE